VQGDDAWRVSPRAHLAETTDQPISIFDSASKTGWIYSYYLQDEWKIIPSVTVNFGARYDQFAEFVSERQLGPRINVVRQPTDTTTLAAGDSRYFVPPPFELIASPTIAPSPTPLAAPAVTEDSVAKAESDQYFDVGGSKSSCPDSRRGSPRITRSPAICSMRGNSGPRSS
jgi:outer membrane receptor protein involved in Fe transport